MKSLRRRIAAPLLVLAFLWGVPNPASAVDNAAIAVNTKDDAFVWRQAFKITRVNDDVADEKNVAWAQASCERCRTAAVAFQVVLITGDAHTITPFNGAFAINELCTSCATYAGAFQYVVTTQRPVHFTEAGSEKIDQIKAELKALIAGATFTAPPPDEEPTEILAFGAEVSALFSRLENVVQTELVRVGGGQIEEVVDVDLAA
jgi:putative peptide zinc metalloprotease protein